METKFADRERLFRTRCAAEMGARRPVRLDRVVAALEDPAIFAAADGHVSALADEEETAHWTDVGAWEACSLPVPPGFDARNPIDQAVIRAALAERIREVLGEA